MEWNEQHILDIAKNKKEICFLNRGHMDFKYCKALADSGFLKLVRIKRLYVFQYNMIS